MSTAGVQSGRHQDRWWRALVDDAALFPPGDAPLEEAVRAHRQHRDAWYAPLVGAFVVGEQRVEELGRVLAGRPFPCLLVVVGGVGAALERARRAGGRLARWLLAAAERDLPVKCTAGMHHAVRHTDPRTGFQHHGFLDVLVAVQAALGAAGEQDVRAVLGQRDGDRLAAIVAGWDPGTRRRARERFSGFGSCSVTEPLDDLLALGLLAPAGIGS